MTGYVEVAPERSIQEAAEQMRCLDVGVLPVCDGDRLVGILPTAISWFELSRMEEIQRE
jgi:CBS domain-containing protein